MNDKPNGKETRIDSLVKQYVAIRSKVSEIKELYKRELSDYEEALDMLSGRMLEFLDASGSESARTKEGTVYASVKYTASLADPDAFMTYVRENDAYELMDRRANSTACREFIEEHNTLPPGVKLSSIRNIGVRKS